MAVSLKVRIRDLLPEFLADALIFLSSFQTAGAVAAGALQTFFDHLDHFLVIVQTYSHGVHILSDSLYDRGEDCQEEGEKEMATLSDDLSLASGVGLESEVSSQTSRGLPWSFGKRTRSFLPLHRRVEMGCG